jgi:2-dehydro-3-deoxyphosphogluconate aldolase/(4S)-4-hydroxy-2-oxoglutarate aldolase
MRETNNKIYAYGLIPVIVLEDSKNAVPLAQVLVRSGLPVMEVTFRTEAAEESIRMIAKNVPEIILGAGTVLTLKQARDAIAAGAQYIVSPGLNPEVVTYCQKHNVDIIAGVSTPTEVEEAIALGLKTMKFFPAESNGGVQAISALSGPYSDVSFIPTGGINAENLSDYLKLENVYACGASYIAGKKMITEGRFDEIEENARSAVKAVHGFKMTHVGINAQSLEEAKKLAETLCALFGLTRKDGRISSFASEEIEVMYDDTYGEHGHMSFTANSIDRACRYLQMRGIRLVENTIKYNDHGKIRFAYIENSVGGVAIHLY